jgi:hypothetical protein
MSFAEVNVFGVYVAPISVMMIGAWLMLVLVRRVADRYGVLRQIWHPTLFWFAVYMILLSAIVLLVGR